MILFCVENKEQTLCKENTNYCIGKKEKIKINTNLKKYKINRSINRIQSFVVCDINCKRQHLKEEIHRVCEQFDSVQVLETSNVH